MSLHVFGVMLTLAGSQGSSKLISFSQPAGRASVVLPALGKAAGVALQATKQTQNEILQIEVKDVSLSDLMTRIATVTEGEWRKSGNAYQLIPSSSLRRKDERQLLDRDIELIRKLLAKDAKAIDEAKDWSANKANTLATAIKGLLDQRPGQTDDQMAYQTAIRKAVSQAPMTWAVKSLVQMVPPEALVATLRGQRVVFALRPNAMQQQLPEAAIGVLNEAIRRQYQYSSAFNALGTQNGRRFGNSLFSNLPDDQFPSEPQGVADALLIFRARTPSAGARYGAGADVDLLVQDKSGYCLNPSKTRLFLSGFPIPGALAITPENAIALDPIGTELAKLSARRINGPAGLDFTGIFMRIQGIPESVGFARQNQNPGGLTQCSGELKSKLLHPETVDPLSLVVGQSISLAAKAQSKNLVANYSDAMFDWYDTYFAENPAGIPLIEVLDKLPNSSGMRVESTGGWITISPKSVTEADGLRIDREALGKLLRAIDGRPVAKLDDVAQYAVQSEKQFDGASLDGVYINTVNPSLGGPISQALQNEDALRIYGTLNGTERARVNSNGSTSLIDLSPDQKRWLFDDVFNSTFGPGGSMPNSRGAGPINAAQQRPRTTMFGISAELSQERTVVLPNGIPSRGQLTFQTVASDGLIGQTPNQTGAAFVTLGDVAARRFQQDHPEFGTPTLLTLFRPASRRRVEMTFQLADGYMLIRQFEDYGFDSAVKPVAFDGLPSETKNTIQDYEAKIRDYASKMNVGRDGTITFSRRTPPPNR